MDKNKTGKREYDDNGRRFKFDCDKFKKVITRAVSMESSDEKRVPKDLIINRLAEEIMTSPETVRKWQSGNSPSDIEKVKDCAKFFNIDYLDLLISCDNKEAHKMTDDEKKLVKKIYEELIDAFYFATDPHRDSECNIIRKRSEDHETEVLNKIDIIHRTIDRSALGTPEDSRNKLHRIIIEAASLISCDYCMDSRWEKIIEDCINDITNPSNVIINDSLTLGIYAGTYDREQGLDTLGNICYIWDEIDLAEKYGLSEEHIYQVPDDGLDEWDGFVHELDRQPLHLYEKLEKNIDEYRDEDGNLPESIIKRDRMSVYQWKIMGNRPKKGT